jgi:hypothetical protein
MIRDHQAQSAVLGIFLVLCFTLLAGGLVDIYRAYAARTWAYSVAQEAALAGASQGRDWDSLSSTGEMRLNETVAITSAESIVQMEMTQRHISSYSMLVQVIPDPAGGEIREFPPRPVRLGSGKGDWKTDEPAVGVFLSVPVDWVLLDSFGILEPTVSVFASAGVAQ